MALGSDRDPFLGVLRTELAKYVPVYLKMPGAAQRQDFSLAEAVQRLEAAAFARGRAYLNAIRLAIQRLSAQEGTHPFSRSGVRYLAGELDPGALVADAAPAAGALPATAPALPPHRETIRRLFAETLLAALPEDPDPARTVRTAELLEESCYRTTIDQCRRESGAPTRSWDCPGFVDWYGSRCGVVNGLLRTDSEARVRYGTALAESVLAGGAARAAEVGAASSAALCPEALRAEVELLRLRATQKIEEKESALFRCGHCGARRSTYRAVQDRGLDEAPSYYCRCLSCGKEFRGVN